MKIGRFALVIALSTLALFLGLSTKDASAGGGAKSKFAKYYLGKHGLGVNRVNDGKRTGKAEIVQEEQALVLTGSVAKGKYSLQIFGIVEPKSRREFVLDGKISGKPNLEFKGVGPKPVATEGKFLFRAKGKRRYWRMYEVNGKDCVCGEGCGNEFCYIDLDFGPPKKR